jgi:protein-S-isoprenylcysteine O-methyltransferase Ste14
MAQTDFAEGVPRRPRLTRVQAIVSSVAAWLVIFVMIPWAIARRGRRLGWAAGRPGLLNRLGVVPVGIGASGLAWCVAAHYRPGETVEVSLVPESLIAAGPYRYSRNPMYVSEQTLLIGWVVYFGSPGLLGCTTALAAAMRYAVSREERTLEGRFGDSWHDYAATVRRWL